MHIVNQSLNFTPKKEHTHKLCLDFEEKGHETHKSTHILRLDFEEEVHETCKRAHNL